MDVPADRSRPTSALPVHPSLREAVRSPRRRRPTGAAPPLPYRLQTSGVGWLVAALVLVGLTLAIFARGLRGPAVTVDGGRRRGGGLAGRPGRAGAGGAAAGRGPHRLLVGAVHGLLRAGAGVAGPAALAAPARVAGRLCSSASNLIDGLAMIARRPRPFGVELRASWGGWAMPSVQVAFLTAICMGVLYTLVPEGRWRNTRQVGGGRRWWRWSRWPGSRLGVDAPTDVLVGVGIGVTIPLLLFRRFTPNEVFPVTYRRGRSAHLDIGGARGPGHPAGPGGPARPGRRGHQAVRAGRARPAPPRCGSPSQGDPPRQLFGKLYAQSHLRSDRWYKLGRELLYGRLEDEKPFNTVRRLVQQEDYALSLMQRAGLPSPTPSGSSSSPPNGSTCWSPSSSPARSSWARPRSTTR